MFGVKTHSNGMLSVSQEAAAQHAIVATEVCKLREMSGLGWHVIEDKCFKKLCNTNFTNGMFCGAVLAVGIRFVIDVVDNKRKSEEE